MAASWTSRSSRFVWSAIALSLPLFGLLPHAAWGSKNRSPNFLFLQADDLNFMANWGEAPPGALRVPDRWNPNVRLPKMDQLRDQSVSSCSPNEWERFASVARVSLGIGPWRMRTISTFRHAQAPNKHGTSLSDLRGLLSYTPVGKNTVRKYPSRQALDARGRGGGGGGGGGL